VSDRVRCTIDAGVADVRLNRPDKLNALDAEMFVAIAETGEALRATPGLRAVVLSGEGRAFCAGLDMAAFGAMADGRTWRPADTVEAGDDGPSRGQRAVLAFRDLPVPVIAAVRGHALGGGLQLALGADIRIAAPDAVFAVLEVQWGLAPDMVGTQLLPRLVGPDVAAELTFTGRRIDAGEAARIGLVTRIAADPYAAAHELAAAIAGRSPDAVRVAKELLAISSFEAGLAAERAGLRRLAGRPNQREAAAAGLARRTPQFTDPQEHT